MATVLETRPVVLRSPERSLRARFLIGAFWSLVGSVGSRGLTLIASMVVARILGTTGFGELGMIQSTQGLFGVFAGAGLGLAATKHVAQYRSVDWPKAARYIALSTRIAVITGLVAAGVLLALSGWIASSILQAPYLAGELRVATGLVLFGAINGVQTGVLAGLEEFRTIAVISMIRACCLIVSMIAGVLTAGLMGAVIGLVLGEGVSAFCNYLALRRHYRQIASPWHSREQAWEDLKGLWRFSMLALLSSLATMPALWFTNVLLANQPEGYASLGIFNAAERWRQLLLFLPVSLSSIILSLLSNLHGNQDRNSYRRVFMMNLWVAAFTVLVPAVGLAFLSRPAMGLFGNDYREGWPTLILLAASALAVVLNTFLGQVLVSRGAIWCRFLMDVLLAVVLAAVSCWLIPAYRENGLALGHLMAYGVTSLALLIPVCYYLKVRTAGGSSANQVLQPEGGVG